MEHTWGERLAGRLGAYAWDQDLDYTVSSITYEGELDLLNLAALVDYHPGGGAFRFTAGLIYTQNEVRGRAPLTALLDEEDRALAQQIAQQLGLVIGDLTGTLEVDPVAPYVGLGAGATRGGWHLSFDLGVMYHGEPDATLQADTDLPLELVPGAEVALELLLAREEAEIEAETDDYPFYPVVALGVSYRF